MIIQFSNFEINVNIWHSTDAWTNFKPLHSLLPTASSQPSEFFVSQWRIYWCSGSFIFYGKNSFFIWVMEADIIHSHLLDGTCAYLVTETVLNLMINSTKPIQQMSLNGHLWCWLVSDQQRPTVNTGLKEKTWYI